MRLADVEFSIVDARRQAYPSAYIWLNGLLAGAGLLFFLGVVEFGQGGAVVTRYDLLAAVGDVFG